MKIIVYNKDDILTRSEYRSLLKEVERWKEFNVPHKASEVVENRCESATNLFRDALEYKSGDVEDDWDCGHRCHKALRLYKTDRGIEGGIYYDIDQEGRVLKIIDIFSAPWNQDKFETRMEGVARQMLYDVFNIGLSKGCNKVILSSIPYSGSFYTRLGFRKIDEDEDGNIMQMRTRKMQEFVDEYKEKLAEDKDKKHKIIFDLSRHNQKRHGMLKHKRKDEVSLSGVR